MWKLIPLLLTLLGFLRTDGEPASGAGTGGTPGNDGTSGQPSGQQGAGGQQGDQGDGKSPEGGKPEDDQPEDTTGLKASLAAARRERDEERRQRQELATRVEQLESGTQTEHERALAQAKREATTAADAKWAVHVRNAEVRGALRAAGIASERFLTLALQAPELANLKVDGDTGEVAGVTEAVEALKKALPEAFAKSAPPPQGGQWDGAQGGGSGKKEPATLEEAVAAHYDQQQRR